MAALTSFGASGSSHSNPLGSLFNPHTTSPHSSHRLYTDLRTLWAEPSSPTTSFSSVNTRSSRSTLASDRDRDTDDFDSWRTFRTSDHPSFSSRAGDAHPPSYDASVSSSNPHAEFAVARQRPSSPAASSTSSQNSTHSSSSLWAAIARFSTRSNRRSHTRSVVV